MELKEIQQYKLNILKDVVNICEKHHLNYGLIYGTMLGAVRHNGFIPWDDDIDIALPWEDYNQFLEICKAELPQKYFVQNYKTDPGFPMLYTQIRVNNTTSMPIKSAKLDIHWGICIDVFPLIGIWERGFGIQKKLIGWCNSCLVTECMEATGMEAYGAQKLINRMPRKLRLGITNLFYKIAFHNSERREYCFGLDGPDICKAISTESWKNQIDWPFEGEKFHVAKDYDQILTRIYGDYMTPPPLEERGGHELQLGEQIVDATKDYQKYRNELLNPKND